MPMITATAAQSPLSAAMLLPLQTMPMAGHGAFSSSKTLLSVTLLGMALLLAGCAGDAGRRAGAPASSSAGAIPKLPAAGSGRGGYYQDDGPGATTPADLQAIPNADPQIEPYGKLGNRPYQIFGITYTPITDDRPLKQRGIGSWYGKKFHGQKTSSGERYDMYKMTAAHPTLPLPSYARVTNLANGAQVIVKVNDRGPFHSRRIIDLSYVAALKLGYLGQGSSELEVERLLPEDIARLHSDQAAGEKIASVAAPVFIASEVIGPDPAAVATTPNASKSLPVIVSLEDFLASQDQQIIPSAQISTKGDSLIEISSIPTSSITTASSATTLPGNFYLQFGAFTQVANADLMRERLMQAWPQALPTLTTQLRGAVYRLYSGPFETRDEALRAGALLAENPLVTPVIVQP